MKHTLMFQLAKIRSERQYNVKSLLAKWGHCLLGL